MDFKMDDEVLDVFKLVRPSIEVFTYIDISYVRRDDVVPNDLP